MVNLDATAGYRKMWGCVNPPDIVFMDKRATVNPDVIAVWGNLPFRDDVFNTIFFDPPHFVWKDHWVLSGKRVGIKENYGSWDSKREIIPALFRAIKEFARVGHILCFKWCDTRDGASYLRFKSIFKGIWDVVHEQRRNNKGFGYRSTWWITFVKRS